MGDDSLGSHPPSKRMARKKGLYSQKGEWLQGSEGGDLALFAIGVVPGTSFTKKFWCGVLRKKRGEGSALRRAVPWTAPLSRTREPSLG